MSIVSILVDRGRLQIFFREDDESAFFVLVALDQIFPRNRLAVALADALVADGRLVFCVQHAEPWTMVAHCRMKLDRNRHEAE